MSEKSKPIISVKGLNVHVQTKAILNDISFEINEGECIAIIGSSGAGKSMTAKALLGLTEYENTDIRSGNILYHSGDQLIELLDQKKWNSGLRMKKMALVFQNASAAINPLWKISRQMSRILKNILNLDHSAALKKSRESLLKAGISDVERILDSYIFQLSGGEQQRVMIAIGLSCDPEILVLDEPTASLDLVIQKEIIQLLLNLKAEKTLQIFFITHDLAHASVIADRIIHLEDGILINDQETSLFFTSPAQPQSQELIKKWKYFQNAPIQSPHGIMKPAVEIQNLSLKFTKGKKPITAVDQINLTIFENEILGIVGESGSGKSSLLKCLAGFYDHYSGQINFHVEESDIFYVFQDAYNSMDPELSVYEIIKEVILATQKRTKKDLIHDEIINSLEILGLRKDILNRRIDELSGGQRQRVNLARALVSKRKILLLDEINSGLDRKVQFEIMELLKKLSGRYTLVFVSHDISLVRYLCERVAIMWKGKIIEKGFSKSILSNPEHDYTKKLLNSIPNVKYLINT